MGNKGKWKTVSQPGPVEVFKVPKTLFDKMNDDSVTHKMLMEDVLNSSSVIQEGNQAIVDLIYKVKDTRNKEAQKFWADRLEALMKVIGINSQMRDRLLGLREDYSKLYDRYFGLLDKVKELEEKLSKYENLD